MKEGHKRTGTRPRYELFINGHLHAQVNNRNSKGEYNCLVEIHKEYETAISNASSYEVYKLVKSKFPKVDKVQLAEEERKLEHDRLVLRRKMLIWFLKKAKTAKAYEVIIDDDYIAFSNRVRERTGQLTLNFKQCISIAQLQELKFLWNVKTEKFLVRGNYKFTQKVA